MSAILMRFSDSPAIDLVRLSSLVLLILKYTISQHFPISTQYAGMARSSAKLGLGI